MKKILIALVAVGLIFGISSISHATVLTFDDIGTPGTHAPIPITYGGLIWSTDFSYINGANYSPTSGYATGAVSGAYTAFNLYARPVSVSNSTPFDFNGAYFASAWRTGLNISVKGFLGSSELFSQTVIGNSAGPIWYDLDFSGIDKVTFSSSGGVETPGLNGSGAHFVMDNFTFNETSNNNNPGVVPEPASMVLLSTGLLGLIGYKRKEL